MFLLNRKYSGNTALIADNGLSLTYEELFSISDNIYQGLGKRDLVFCICNNTVGSVCGYISFVENRVVPVMIDSSMNREMMEQLITLYQPAYLWLPTDQIAEFPIEKKILSVFDYSLVKLTYKKSAGLHDDLALLLTTSGSTGSPKLVRLSYNNIKANAESIAEYLSITETERPITVLPMHYSFGLSIINSHLIKGATLLMTNRSLMEKEFWQFLKNEKATSFSGVPYTYEMLKRLRFFRMELPSLTTLTQAGGRLSIELQKEFAGFCKENNKRFFVMYGQTEATARMSYLPVEKTLEKPGSIGIAIPGGTFSLIDDNGSTILESDKPGELVYKGGNVSMGYAECADDLGKEDENKGILLTGDIAKRDADHFYYIVGRKKRFIKLFGNRVNLDETERLLKTIVSDCACVGNDDHMVVYITEHGREQEVQQFISSKTGLNHTAFEVRYCESIPKNSSGKTLYANLDV